VGRAWGSHCRGPWSPAAGSGARGRAAAKTPERDDTQTNRHVRSVHYIMMTYSNTE